MYSVMCLRLGHRGTKATGNWGGRGIVHEESGQPRTKETTCCIECHTSAAVQVITLISNPCAAVQSACDDVRTSYMYREPSSSSNTAAAPTAARQEELGRIY